ncbi:MAG: GNAT family N-acetyltransferase [Armatimonadota bacterium]
MISSELDAEAMKAFHFRGDPVFTYRAPLYPGDEARAMKMLKDSARRNVRRAEKLGLITRFEEDESFVDEHYDQLKEVFLRGGNIIPFNKKRVLEYFRHMKAAGNLLAISVYLPDEGGNEVNIATGTFTVEGHELLLWMWAHRTQYRWYRPTELMTWMVMKKAMERGCDTFDFMGRGEFKTRLGAELDGSQHRWIRSRYGWLTQARSLAEKGYRWQQSFRGRMSRQQWSSLLGFGAASRTQVPRSLDEAQKE